MATIEITWSAFAEYGKEIASASFDFAIEADDLAVCERVFHDTNTYGGELWDALQPVIPARRSHTALSVGDKVSIDGRTYRCEMMGFALVA